MRPRIQSIVHNLRYFDAVVVAIVGALMWEWQFPVKVSETLLLMGMVPVTALLLQYYGLYESHRVEGLTQVTRSLLSALLVGWGGGVALALGIGLSHRIPIITWILLTAGGALLSYRIVVYAGLKLARAHGFDQRLVCVVGDGVKSELIREKFSGNASWGYRLAYAIAAPDEGRVEPEAVLLTYDFEKNLSEQKSLLNLLQDRPVDEIMVWTSTERVQDYRPILSSCREHGLPTRVVLKDSRFLVSDPQAAAAETIGGDLSLQAGASSQDSLGMAVKRLTDIVVSSALILLLMPLFLLIALLVKLSSPGPVLFLQPRMGRNGRAFRIWKFRTMVEGAEVLLPALAARNITEGVAFKSRDDWRVTPVGRWLRRFSLDELPQLFNVLHGTMSLVGPRPLPVREAIQITGPYRRRFSVRPGITCVWQVNGRSDVTFGRWMLMDLEYVDGWSLWLDAKLLLRTIPAVLSGRGSY